MTAHVELRPGAYADSVSLMLASRTVAERPDIEHALLAMATPLNIGLAAAAGYDVPTTATADDLLIAVRLTPQADQSDISNVVEAALRATSGPPAGEGSRDEGWGALAPHTVGAAARRTGRSPSGGRGVAVISVPGKHAVVEAVDAIEHGLHPMLFSDHVAVSDEVALKDLAAERGLLVMGPDCGTVILDGVGFGFANVVPPGPIGLVAASGTGAQQICCLLADGGLGVRHVLGVGGRDLGASVAGRSTLRALALLDADPATEVVVLVSKPPDPRTAAAVHAAAEALATPVVMGVVGSTDLAATAQQAAAAIGHDLAPPAVWPARDPAAPRPGGHLRGLFAGGTLAAEAAAIAGPVLGSITHDPDADGHLVVDLGDDRYTEGRAHPMIDQSLRLDRLAAEAARAGDHVLLLDVILGHGAHPDPAGELAPAIEQARAASADQGGDLCVIVTLVGGPDDPQGRDEQAERLRAAGALVFAANADAVRAALSLLEPGS